MFVLHIECDAVPEIGDVISWGALRMGTPKCSTRQ